MHYRCYERMNVSSKCEAKFCFLLNSLDESGLFLVYNNQSNNLYCTCLKKQIKAIEIYYFINFTMQSTLPSKVDEIKIAGNLFQLILY